MSEQKIQDLTKEISELVERKEDPRSPEDDNWNTEVKTELEKLVQQIQAEHPDGDTAEIIAALETIKQNIETGDEALGEYLEISTLINGVRSEFERIKRIFEAPSLAGLTGSDLSKILKATFPDSPVVGFLEEFTKAQQEESIYLSRIPAGRTYEAIMAFTPKTSGELEKLEANTQALIKIIEEIPTISERLQSPEFSDFQQQVQERLKQQGISGEVSVAEMYQDFYITKEKKLITVEYWEGIQKSLTDIGITTEGANRYLEFEEMRSEENFDTKALTHLISEIKKALPDFPRTLFGMVIAQGHFMQPEDPFSQEAGIFNPERLAQVKDGYEQLKQLYGNNLFDTTNENQWMQFLYLTPETLEPFLDTNGVYFKVWKEISRFPELAEGINLLNIIELKGRAMIFSAENISQADRNFYEYVEIYESQEGVELGKLQTILQIFGFSLEDLSFYNHDTAIYELADYRPFYIDVDTLHTQYPDLKDVLTPELAIKIAKHYKNNEDSFEKITQLNELLQRLGMPLDLSFMRPSLKQKILERLESSGVNPADLDWHTTSRGHLDWGFMEDATDEIEAAFHEVGNIQGMREYIVELIDSGEAKKFYDAIRNIWKIENIEAEIFFDHFTEPSERPQREALMNPENPKRLQQIAAKFEIPNVNFESFDELSRQAGRIRIATGEKFEILMKYEKEIKEQIPKLKPDGFEDVGEFLRWALSLELLLTEEGAGYAAILEQRSEENRFGYEFNKTSRDYFLGSKEFAVIGEVLEDPEFQEAYKQILKWKTEYTPAPDALGDESIIGEEPNQVMDLRVAYRIFKNPAAIPIVNLYLEHFTLEHFRIDLEWVIKILPKNNNFKEAMENPAEFKAFIQKCKDELYESDFHYPEDLYTLSVLYVQIKQYPEREDILFSERFTETQNLIIETIKLNPEHWPLEQHEQSLPLNIESYPAVLELASSGVEPEVLLEWAKRLNTPQQPFYPNDHTLLVEELRQGEDLVQYEDPTYRVGLIEEITALLPDSPFIRAKHGYIDNLRRDLAWAEADGATNRAERLRTEVEELRSQYTETPELEALSTLELSRIHQIIHSLQNAAIQETIGQMISADIVDKTTEHGGIFDFVEGQLIPVRVPSDSHDDGAYGGQMYKEFHGGLTTFHFHSLSVDHSEYAGPSGYGSDGGGDLGVAGNFNTPGVVFTSLGHPGGDTGKLLFNVDYYFIRKNGEEEKEVAIDLGTFEVPYVEPGK